MKRYLILLVFLFAISFVSAAHETKLGFQAWVTNTAGAPVTTGDFLINISDSNDCNGDIYSNTFTDEFTSQGIIDEILTLNMDYNKDYYLCPFVNLEQVGGPYNFRGGQGEIGVEDVSFSITGGNPFNQVLNTTSNVTFYNVTSSGDIWCNSTDCYDLSDFLTGGDLGNPFDQSLNTTDNPVFNGLNLSGNLFPVTTLTYDIGSGEKRWRVLYVQNISSENIDTYNVVASENITADYFIGSGAYLDNLNVSGDLTGYALNISFLYGVVGGMDLRGDPWWLGGTDLEIEQDLLVNNTEVVNDLLVGNNITSTNDGWCNSTNCYTIANFLASSLGNPFDQVLNTTSTVLFNNTNITTRLLVGDNYKLQIADNEIDFWDAGIVKYDDVKISSASNTLSLYARDEDDKDKYAQMIMSPTTGYTLSFGTGTRQFYSDSPASLGIANSPWDILYALNLSNGTSTVSMDTIVNLSATYVPYTGATDEVNLDKWGLITNDRISTPVLLLTDYLTNSSTTASIVSANDLVLFNVSDQYQTYNSTYNTWAYNQTTATYNLYNDAWSSTFNQTYADWNKTYADTLYQRAGNYFNQQLNTTSTDVQFFNISTTGDSKMNGTLTLGGAVGGNATLQLNQGAIKGIKITLPTLGTGLKTYQAPAAVGSLNQVLGITSVASNFNGLGWISTKIAGTGDNVNVTSKLVSFSWVYDDRVVICNATNTNVIGTLARPGLGKGYLWTMKRIDNNLTNNCTIKVYGTDGELLDGLSDYNLTAQYQKATVVSDGTHYWIVG